MDRLKQTEKLLQQCEEDLATLKQLQQTFKRIESNRKQLNDYYQNQYLDDYDNFSDATIDYRILNQDSIWNVLSEQYEMKIKLLKTIIKSI